MRYYTVAFFVEVQMPRDDELDSMLSMIGRLFGFGKVESQEIGVFFIVEKVIDTNEHDLDAAIDVLTKMITDRLSLEVDMDGKYPDGWKVVHQIAPFIGRDM